MRSKAVDGYKWRSKVASGRRNMTVIDMILD